MTERSIAFTLTPEDYIAAQHLHARRQMLRPPMLALFAIFAAVFFFGVFAPTGDPFLNRLMVIVALVVFAMIPFNYFFLLPRRTRKIFAQQKTLSERVEASWSPEDYSASNATNSGTIRWADYHKWDSDEKIVLLYQSDILFQMIPRTALTDAQLSDIRALARTAGLKGA